MGNESFFSAPQLKRGPLGGTITERRVQSSTAIRHLWDELSASTWLTWQAGQATEERRAQVRRILRRYRKSPQARFIGAGRTLVVRDLAEFPADNWARYYPAARQGGFGAEYLRLLKDIHIVQNAWGIVHGFEAFERFLRTVAAMILARDQGAITVAWRDLRRRVPTRRQQPRSVRGWLKRIEASNPALSRLWRFAASQLPSALHTSTRNNRALDLSDWLRAVDVLRQAAVHTNLVVPKTKWTSLPGRVQSYLRSFTGRARRVGFALTPDNKKAIEVLGILAECGFVLYRGLAEAEGIDPAAMLRVARAGAA